MSCCRGAAGASKPSLPVFVLALGITIVAAMLAWTILRGLWRAPERLMRRTARTPSGARPPGRSPKGCWRSATAIPPPRACMPMSRAAMPRTIRWRCCCTRNPRSSTATAKARSAPSAPWSEREDTRLLGLRGLFIEAQRADDPVAAVMIAEEALKLAPASTWASHAVLGFRCAKGDWSGRADHSRQQSRVRADRQGGLSGASAACC